MFDNQEKETPPQTNTENNAGSQTSSNSSPFDTILSDIKNERGERKYHNVEDGLKALKHSQEYIASLKQDLQAKERQIQELSEAVSKVKTLEETITKLTQRQSETSTNAPQLDEETLANLVDRQLTIKEQQTIAQNNQRTVVKALSESFGDKAKDVFYEKASQLGLPPDELEALSAKSPQAVLTMFGIGTGAAPKQAFNPVTRASVNTEQFQGNPTSFIGAETEKIPLGGGEEHFSRILENSKNMVEELRQSGMSIDDLTNPVNFMKYMRKGK